MPRLERAQYVGEWRGEDHAVARCTAVGTWRERPADTRFHRRAGADLIVKDSPACPPPVPPHG
ncbi:hypothetical protein B6R96_20280 [Streptomyces sp. Sge12]|nr:hypothetical protein B6R96_20280 [Streptomyces sp. Sge12]